MELVPFKPAAGAGALVESGGAGSIPAMVAAQQATLHAQVDQLQRFVVAQCHLTGVNPLAQEMAAGALSIKIGKKPRDLLSPKAVNSMQSLFAVKDTIGKRETREISALCGVTVTQVREFFASQRTRVRKAVRLSREKALELEASRTPNSVCSMSTEQTPLDIETHAQVVEPLNTLGPVEVLQSSSQQAEAPLNSLQQAEAPQNSVQQEEAPQNSLQQAEVQQSTATPTPIAPMGTTEPADAKINPGSVQKETKQEEVAPGVESEDKKFLDSIFALMRKEGTFSGQVKLMQWILQINNVTILSWFLTMGGLTIVSTWLSEAAIEEQTTVILVIFKVLLHLPLHKALPAHMSAVLQAINRLRFYRTQDISSRARNLLSRLSKVLIRNQASKKPQKDVICKQRISEILRDDSWRSEVDITEEILALTEGASESRKAEPKKTPLLLTASTDDSYKKSPVQTKSKERRKVLLVEHPNRKAAGKNVHSARSLSTNNSRPLSADDIQKAKMRAMFMQEKYGKVDKSKVTDKLETTETQKPFGLVSSNVPPMPTNPLTSTSKQPVDPSPSTPIQNGVPLPDNPETLGSPKLNIADTENSVVKLDSKRVCWQIPPEVWIDPSWSVSTGENSKELDVQTQRNRRGKETFYASLRDIPLNPKDPWDLEMDFDDSLTPEIPIDQAPDAEAMDLDSVGAAPPDIGFPGENKQVGSTSSSSLTVPADANGAATEPDLELLAVLLKNPQLVFALSSNQVGNLPNDQTVALLDMLKQTGLGLSDLVNTLSNGAGVPKEPEPGPEMIPTSLPSPTPPKDFPANAGWRSEFPTQASAANLQQAHLSDRGNAPLSSAVHHQSFSNVVSLLPSQPYTSVSAMPEHIQSNTPSLPQLAVSVNPRTQHVAPVNNLLNRTPVHQHTQPYAMVSDPAAVAIHQQSAVNKPAHEFQNITNPAPAHSFTPDPNASYTTFPWQSSAANAASTRRSTTPDPWAAPTTNSFNDPSLAYLNQSAYNNQSAQTTYDAYGTTPVSSQGLARNGYAQTSEYQVSGRVVSQQRHSLSPEPGAAGVYGGTQGYIPEPSKLGNYGQQSYNSVASRDWSSGQQSYTPAEQSRQLSYTPAEPSSQQSYTPAEQPSRQWSSGQQSYAPAEPSRQQSYASAEPSRQQSYAPAEPSRQQSYAPAEPPRQQRYTTAETSRQWSSGQQSYTPAEPSRQWTSGQQGYTPPDPSRQWSSGQQSYTPAEPSRTWSTANQSQNPDTSSQWTTGKQDYYNPSDGQNAYGQRRRRRWE